ncbi:MAG: hypothetical protein K8T90_09850 [Planctomycetes bacterium]|nr:hypothetical protein [Planctomycetota bacterium]
MQPARCDASGIGRRLRQAARRKERGASLLEMSVALLVLALTVVGLSRLLAAHSRLLDATDAWCRGAPTFHVVRPPDPLARLCGEAATLATEAPDPEPTPAGGEANDVEIVSVTRELSPPTAVATVRVTPR